MTDDPLHNDARTAHLFQCGNIDLFAVSLDKTGANIPLADCGDGWRFPGVVPTRRSTNYAHCGGTRADPARDG
jgi:hypothetical protein